jgi:hypothetical protein
MTKPILPSQNKSWGFLGAVNRYGSGGIDPDTAWELAFQAIREATGADDEDIRLFLDSCHGRHFADDVTDKLCSGHSLKEAIKAAISRWMGWTISHRTSRDTGIPASLPYLTGFVLNAGIEAEL